MSRPVPGTFAFQGFPPMRVAYAFLAGSAEAVDGKLYVMGGDLDTVFAPRLPIPFVCAVVFKLLVSEAERGRPHPFKLEFSSAAGISIAKMEGRIEEISAPKRPVAEAGALMVIPVMTVFPEAGEYTMRGVVDDEEMFRLTLYVEKQAA